MKSAPDPIMNRFRRSGVPSVPSQTAHPCGTEAMDPLLVTKLCGQLNDHTGPITIAR